MSSDAQPQIIPSSRQRAGAKLEVSLYLLTFPNGKSYVGISKRPNVRLKEHRKRAENGATHAIYQAWRKHGEPIMQIIGKATNYETGFAMEIALIDRLNTKAPNGYNMTDGGDALIGVIRGENWRAKITESNQRRGADPIEREMRRAATVQCWSDPEYRAKVNIAREAKQAELRTDPDWKARKAAKAAETMRKKWQDPEYLAKMALRKPPVLTPEARARAVSSRLANMTAEQHAEAVKKSWATRKARMSEQSAAN